MYSNEAIWLVSTLLSTLLVNMLLTGMLLVHRLKLGRSVVQKIFSMTRVKLFILKFLLYLDQASANNAIRTASANSVEFYGIRPWMFIEDLL